ncbi:MULTISPECIES: amino acid adenylation domain-containing protein [unclassified Ruminococcus]|uniref:amino acid adenylation domain-containing protein n=1 Tax=unclassified Ruminococcus TaxID=2608920 RepID=UPI002109DA4D|nr:MULTISPECIES: amino acid adenylation domain-containing protein [unclassified Ruminococcus]MCQ4022542.1 amino acid adenylation domain-containing protein [Ruminococcus sp. zg-924]MCQ4114782.1 amino acid adenylation domain-containing protein [Ruminococcus sp. zg-921]
MNISVLDWLNCTAEKYPNKTAFSDSEKSISFSEYNRYTKSIGSYLAEFVTAGSPVVVMTGRHIFTPACFLGIVRAGCFYAPIDATMPQARLNQIINVIKAEYMIVDREHLEIASALDFSGRIIVMEDILDYPCNESLLAQAVSFLNEQAPLYVIFTSGSTGVPKGVITSHHSLMCYIDAVSEVLKVDDNDVFGSQSPLDYIAAVRDIYLPIKTGASTVIIPKSEFSMPTQLFDTLNKNKVTALCWSVAGVELPAKLGAFDVLKPEYLKKVCFSGSVMPGKYLRIWQQALPDVMYVNQYGPTEATASCTYYVVDKEVTDDTVLPIGVPYKNYSIMLLNEDGTATQQGEIGEICVKGPILALGYYGNPEKTDESFIQNPLNKNYRELIYKTGDLGSWNEDGLLEFHGRMDRQIKHMGHRIELGEIEATAKQLDNISDCCALYNKEKEHLYLFYTGIASSKEIVLHFRRILPAFMVPRKLVNLDALPVLPNGKTDMQALKTYFK